MKFILRLFVFVNIAFALALLISYLAPVIDPRIIWIFQIFGLFYHFLLLTNILFILFWFWVKKKYAWISVLAIAIGLFHISKAITVNGGSANPSDLKVMTFNMSRFISWKKDSGHRIRHENYVEFKNQLEKYKPDVLILQEDIKDYRDTLSIHGGFTYTCSQGSILMLSKYPMGPCHMERLGNGTNGYINALLYMPKDTLNLFAVHLPSNRIGFRDVQQLKGENIREKKTWKVFGSTLKRYKEATKKRMDLAEEIAKRKFSSTHRCIIAGDFNEVPMSKVHNTLTQGMQDAFAEAGNGLGVTYKKLLHSLRIDYILVDDRMKINSYEVLQPSFSDHYPSIAHISLASRTVK